MTVRQMINASVGRKTDEALPLLHPGDCLDQPTFHARYEAMPEDTRAELIGGVVYMPSPLSLSHGSHHAWLITWLGNYFIATPGTNVVDNATTILGKDSEPQPDAALILIDGQTRKTRIGKEEYLSGAPEFIAEVALSSESIDLHAKKRDYERHGVREYLALRVRDASAVWFVRDGDRFVELPPDQDGIHRSRIFPGLWLDATALLRGDMKRVQDVLNQGLATPEHGAFLVHLSQRS